MPGNERLWGFNVSEGLEHGNAGNLPGSGKSCNKGNKSGADAPAYSATCSLFVSPPGLRIAGAAGAGICPRTADHTARLPPSAAAVSCGRAVAGLRGPARATFRGERSDAHAQVTAFRRKSPSAGLSPVAAG